MMKNLFQKLFGLNRLETVDAGYEQRKAQWATSDPSLRALKRDRSNVTWLLLIDYSEEQRSYTPIDCMEFIYVREIA